MKRRITIATATILVLASLASAQAISPDPDGMSVYFDLYATNYCAYVFPGAYMPVTAYLILTRPTTPLPAVLAWEARLIVDANPIVPVPATWTLAQLTDQNFGAGYDYIVGTTTPPLAITGDATVLASITLWYVGYEVDPYASFSIGRTTGSTTFPEGAGYTAEVGFPIPCRHIFDNWGGECAWINQGWNCVSPNEDMSWGGIKALY